MENKFLKAPEYAFLKNEPILGDNIILLSVRGYGTNRPDSDYDVRGCALPRLEDLCRFHDFESYVDGTVDTSIYSLHKFIKLLTSCNPHTLEIVGFPKEEFLYLSPAGEYLWENRSMFYSKKAYLTFAGYASMQLNRMVNAMARGTGNSVDKEQLLRRSLLKATSTFSDRYRDFSTKQINFVLEENETPELLVDMHFDKLPVSQLNGMLGELQSVMKSYDKLKHRNNKKDDLHLNKHAMHLVRIYLAGISLAKTGEFWTSAQPYLDILLPIRDGQHREDNGTGPIKKEFMEYLHHLEHEMEEAFKQTSPPEQPRYERIKLLEETIVKEFVLS